MPVLTFRVTDTILETDLEVRKVSKMGRPKSEDPANHFVNVRMTDERFNRLKAYAELYNLTMTEIVVTAVEEYLDKREDKTK